MVKRKVISSVMWQNYETLPHCTLSKLKGVLRMISPMTWQICTYHSMASKKVRWYVSNEHLPSAKNYGVSRGLYQEESIEKSLKHYTAPTSVTIKMLCTF